MNSIFEQAIAYDIADSGESYEGELYFVKVSDALLRDIHPLEVRVFIDAFNGNNDPEFSDPVMELEFVIEYYVQRNNDGYSVLYTLKEEV